jgi:hypothetical protein
MYTKNDKGPIEVHFQDSEHLRSILNEMPFIAPKNNLYFVKHKEVKKGQEIVSPEGELQIDYFIHFISDSPLTLEGNLNRYLPYSIYLPKRSYHTNFYGRIKGQVSCSAGFKSFTQAHNLADALDTFDNKLWREKTLEAYKILKERQEDRIKHPQDYPNPFKERPSRWFVAPSGLTISDKDYISSDQPLIYIAPSLSKLKKIKEELPIFINAIHYINPEEEKFGLYTQGSLRVDKGFKIFSPGNLIVMGRIDLPEYNLKFKSIGSTWLLTELLSGLNISILSKHSMTLEHFLTFIPRQTRQPQGMLTDEWLALTAIYRSMMNRGNWAPVPQG